MRILILLVVLFSSTLLQAQQVDLYRHFAGPGVCYPQEQDMDAAGNHYITGYFSTNFDADPGAGVTTLTSAGGWDIFIIKMDPQLNLIWAKSIGGTQTETGEALNIDAEGNIVISGSFNATVDFDPGPGIANLVEPANSTALTVAFIAKYTSNGDYIYAYPFSSLKESRIRSIDVDAQSNVFLSGTFDGTMDADPGPGTTTLTSKTNVADLFFCKFNKGGNLCWAKRAGGGNGYDMYATVVDEQAGFFSAGSFIGKTDFDPGADTAFIVPRTTGFNFFILKLDTAGNYRWAVGPGKGTGYSLAYKSDGHILFGGGFEDTVDFDPGPGVNQLIASTGTDGFILDLDAQGNFGWVKTFKGAGTTFVRDINLDNVGNIYASGFLSGQADLDPSAGTANFTSNGSDVFVSKLSSTGTYQSAFTLTGTGSQFSYGCFFGTDNNPIVMGAFENTLTIQPIQGTFGITSAGLFDFYLVHVVPGTTATLDLTESQEINLFPNPAHDWLSVKLNDNAEAIPSMVFDGMGKQVITIDNPEKIDVRSLTPGVYSIKVGNAMRRFVKE